MDMSRTPGASLDSPSFANQIALKDTIGADSYQATLSFDAEDGCLLEALKNGSAGDITLSGGKVNIGSPVFSGDALPAVDGTSYLGSSSKRWANIYTESASIGGISYGVSGIYAEADFTIDTEGSGVSLTIGSHPAQDGATIVQSGAGGVTLSASGSDAMVNPGADGTHTLGVSTVRWKTVYSKGLNVAGTNGYGQLTLATSYTPTGTSDSNGSTGDICWDASYVYVKTAAGWKRAALSTW